MSTQINLRVLLPLLAVCAIVAGFTVWTNVNAQAGPAQAALSVRTQPSTAAAAYIKFDGVDGESQDKDHKDWSNLVSFAQGIEAPRRGATSFEDIVVTKELDKSSPKLAEAIARGKVFPTVVFELAQNYPGTGQVSYLQYELKNVRITSYSVGGSASERSTETLSLNFEEIKVSYDETDDRGAKKGNVEYSWKVEEGSR